MIWGYHYFQKHPYAHTMVVPMHLQRKRAARQPGTLDTEGPGSLGDCTNQSIWLQREMLQYARRVLCFTKSYLVHHIFLDWNEQSLLNLPSLCQPAATSSLSASTCAVEATVCCAALTRMSSSSMTSTGCCLKLYSISNWLPRTLARRVTGHNALRWVWVIGMIHGVIRNGSVWC